MLLLVLFIGMLCMTADARIAGFKQKHSFPMTSQRGWLPIGETPVGFENYKAAIRLPVIRGFDRPILIWKDEPVVEPVERGFERPILVWNNDEETK